MREKFFPSEMLLLEPERFYSGLWLHNLLFLPFLLHRPLLAAALSSVNVFPHWLGSVRHIFNSFSLLKIAKGKVTW